MKACVFLISVLLSIVLCDKCTTRHYPTYKQCDSKWGGNKIGTSSKTISSVSMALKGCGHDYNPGTLNKWLTSHGGYVSGDLFVWGSVSQLGLTFKEFVTKNSTITNDICQNHVVILNVNSGHHYVLATGCTDKGYDVNDPGYSKSFYAVNEVVRAAIFSKC